MYTMLYYNVHDVVLYRISQWYREDLALPPLEFTDPAIGRPHVIDIDRIISRQRD